MRALPALRWWQTPPTTQQGVGAQVAARHACAPWPGVRREAESCATRSAAALQRSRSAARVREQQGVQLPVTFRWFLLGLQARFHTQNARSARCPRAAPRLPPHLSRVPPCSHARQPRQRLRRAAAAARRPTHPPQSAICTPVRSLYFFFGRSGTPRMRSILLIICARSQRQRQCASAPERQQNRGTRRNASAGRDAPPG